MKRMIFTALLVALMLAAPGQASVPHVFNYQGYLADLDGTPLQGNHNLVFRIYDVAAGADPALWTETHTLVAVVDGVFSVLLGSLVDLPPSVLAEDELWIGVTVGADTEIAPRLQVTSTPWAYRAAIADSSVVTGAGGGEGGTVFQVNTGSGLTGGPITTSGTISVAPSGITTSHLNDDAVTGAKLDNDSVTSAHIVFGTVTGSDIADGSVTTSDIANGTVTSADIADGAVTSADIALGAVHSDDIANDSITYVDIMDEPGVASINNGQYVGITNTPVNVLARTITVPSSGYVVAMASCYGYLTHTTGTDSRIYMSVSQNSQSINTDNDVIFFRSQFASSGNRLSGMSCNDVFPVTGAQSKTFYMVARSDVGGDNRIYSASLVLMYFPENYGSVTKSAGMPAEAVE